MRAGVLGADCTSSMGSHSSTMASRISALLVGPELYWVFAYVVAYLLAARNSPPTPAGNAFLERMWWLFPLLTVPFSYLLYLAPNAGRWGLLIRINVAAAVGLTFCLVRLTSAIDYRDSRNSGVFGGFVIGIGVGVLLLTVCDIVAAARFWMARPH